MTIGNSPDEEHEDPHGECRAEIHRLAARVQVLEGQLEMLPFMRVYIATLHKYKAVDESIMSRDGRYLPLEDIMPRWGVVPIK